MTLEQLERVVQEWRERAVGRERSSWWPVNLAADVGGVDDAAVAALTDSRPRLFTLNSQGGLNAVIVRAVGLDAVGVNLDHGAGRRGRGGFTLDLGGPLRALTVISDLERLVEQASEPDEQKQPARTALATARQGLTFENVTKVAQAMATLASIAAPAAPHLARLLGFAG